MVCCLFSQMDDTEVLDYFYPQYPMYHNHGILMVGYFFLVIYMKNVCSVN